MKIRSRIWSKSIFLSIIVLVATLHIFVRCQSLEYPLINYDEPTTIFPALKVASSLRGGNFSSEYIYRQIFTSRYSENLELVRPGLQIGFASLIYLLLSFLGVPFTEVTLHFPSLAAGWFCVLAVGITGWKLGGPKAGVVAALTFVLIPEVIFNHGFLTANITFIPTMQVLIFLCLLLYARTLRREWIWAFWFLVSYQVGDDNGFFLSLVLYVAIILFLWRYERKISTLKFGTLFRRFFIHPGLLMAIAVLGLRLGWFFPSLQPPFLGILSSKFNLGWSLGWRRWFTGHMGYLGYPVGTVVLLSLLIFPIDRNRTEYRWGFLFLFWIALFELPVILLNGYELYAKVPLVYTLAPAALVVCILFNMIKRRRAVLTVGFLILAFIPGALRHYGLVDTVIHERHSVTVEAIRAQGYAFREAMKKGVSEEDVVFPYQGAFIYTGCVYSEADLLPHGAQLFTEKPVRIAIAPQHLLDRKVRGVEVSNAVERLIDQNNLNFQYRILKNSGVSCIIYSRLPLFDREVLGQERELARLFIKKYARLDAIITSP